MDFSQLAILLFLVIDPFGNLPIVIATLSRLSDRDYRRAVARETAAAFILLAAFAWAGEQILGQFGIAYPSLHVAGGIILFIISVRMIFRGAVDAFDDAYAEDPWFVPIAVPSITGPAAITTVMIVKTQSDVTFAMLLAAVTVVFLLSFAVFVFGRHVARWLQPRGMRALERLMGLLLCLLSVNMTLYGLKVHFA